EAALVQFQAAVKASPENFEALYNYGTTCLRLDKREEALEYLKRAVTLKPDAILARKNLALAYRRQGNAMKAFQEYRSLTRLFPDEWEPWVQAARLLKRPERDAEVIRFLSGAWRIDPERTAQLIASDQAFASLDKEKIAGAAPPERDDAEPSEVAEPPPSEGDAGKASDSSSGG
ncbi:MAG: tetratricopeptide repeat protein, partial [Planctomycetota bacterium]